MINNIRMSRIFILLFSIGLLASCDKASFPSEAKAPIDHVIWDDLLQIHVDTNGWVDYKGLAKDKEKLNEYLRLLSENHPNTDWSEAQRKAYWINAYNAFTVKLIVDHYPVEGIKEIKKGIPFLNSVWDIDLIDIQGISYTLNDIEHQILRKRFNDPRIHFGINCASYSCPRLHYRAYDPKYLDLQLEQATEDFINDSRRNIVKRDELKLSKIFSWFGKDFKRGDMTLRKFINEYANEPAGAEVEIEFMDYDWSLNESRNKVI